jgi:D-amino-acid dehydrogenase
MRIVVVGAGIAGAVTALTLAREGCQVEVLESGPFAATGASFANAGLVSPGHCFSWAEPGVASVALQSLLGRGDGISVSPPWTPSLWRWGALFAREATRDRWMANSKAALALAAYSRDLQFGANDVPLDSYGGRHGGILYLYGQGNRPGPHDQALLNAAGEAFETLDDQQLLEREPILRTARQKFDSAVFCPNDGTGDAARYARAALDEAIRLGATVRFGETVRRFEVRGTSVAGVQTDRALYLADAVVVAAGLASRRLLATTGCSLPIHPVTGYSISYEVASSSRPCVGAVSIPHKVAWAAFGETVRFTGFADIGIPGPAKVEERFRALQAFGGSIYPEIEHATPSRWVGQRPMTPDNLPFLGASGLSNLWLNCGHGAMGWTMACGSARVIADLILGHEPALDLEPFRWDRYGLLRRRRTSGPEHERQHALAGSRSSTRNAA